MIKLERKNILDISYSPMFISGSEGNINRVNDMKLFKEFHNDMSLVIRNRKIRKLDYLYSCKEIEKYYVKLYYIVMNILEPRGYVMENVLGVSLEGYCFRQEQLISILDNLKHILINEYYRMYGILYLDIRTPNLRVNNEGNLIILDQDNIITPSDSIDAIPSKLKEYCIKGGDFNINALIYMFNEFTLDFLSYERYHLDKEGEEILNDSLSSEIDNSFDHELLFEHITGFEKRNDNELDTYTFFKPYEYSKKA